MGQEGLERGRGRRKVKRRQVEGGRHRTGREDWRRSREEARRTELDERRKEVIDGGKRERGKTLGPIKE